METLRLLFFALDAMLGRWVVAVVVGLGWLLLLPLVWALVGSRIKSGSKVARRVRTGYLLIPVVCVAGIGALDLMHQRDVAVLKAEATRLCERAGGLKVLPHSPVQVRTLLYYVKQGYYPQRDQAAFFLLGGVESYEEQFAEHANKSLRYALVEGREDCGVGSAGPKARLHSLATCVVAKSIDQATARYRLEFAPSYPGPEESPLHPNWWRYVLSDRQTDEIIAEFRGFHWQSMKSVVSISMPPHVRRPSSTVVASLKRAWPCAIS